MSVEHGIDWELAVSLANNNEETAKQLLQLLAGELSRNKADAQRYFDAKDFNSLCNLAHKLHGASCYCGVPQLKASARQLEEALRTQQLDSLDALFTQFITAIEEIQNAAPKIIGDPV